MTTVKVTSRAVAGLTDGFTGEPLSVVMTITPGVPPLYSCPEAFSVHVPHDSLASLKDDVSMEGGVRGIRDAVNPVDPYTGDPLKLRVFPDGRFAYSGGLNPRTAFKSLEELRYRLSMRGGVSKYPRPGQALPVTKPERAGRELGERNAPSDATKEAVEKVVSEHMPRGTQVSMSGRTGKPRGGRRG